MGLLQDMIMQQMTTAVKDKLGAQTGQGSGVSNDAIQTTLDAILGGLKSNTSTKSGADTLDTTIAKNHDGSILSDLAGAIGGSSNTSDGGKILDHIFGSNKDDVASKVGKQTGLDKKAAIALMIALAPVVLAQLGKMKQDKNMSARDVADQVQQSAQQSSGSGGLGGLVSSMLDQNHDGNVVDDVLRFGESFLGGKK